MKHDRAEIEEIVLEAHEAEVKLYDDLPDYVAPNSVQIGGSHYKKMGIDPWQVIDTWPLEQQIGAHRQNTLKYLMRMGTKDDEVQELRKARHCLDKLIEVLENARD